MASCYREDLFRLFYPNRPTRGPLRVWSPPPDPDRPSLPYLPGFKAHIQSHVAPAPFRHERLYDSWPREMVSHGELETLTQNALVVSHPPIEATTAPSDTKVRSETAQLTITSQIRGGCEGGAQVVVCTVAKDGEPPFEAVAKIYDALYYRFSHSVASRVRDVTTEAGKDYTAEAGAYKRLTSVGRASQVTPAYYGSWTFNLPITSGGVEQMRPDRLVLIEHLRGSNPKGLRIRNSAELRGDRNAFHFPEEYRLEVLARAMDAYVRSLHCGVEQNDFADCNVVLCSEDTSITTHMTGTDIPRVVLVDYNVAIVYSCTLGGRRGDFVGWAPPEWEGVEKPMQEWLLQRFGSEEQRALYEPVTKELKVDEW